MIEVTVFASLKDHFGNNLSIEKKQIGNVENLIDYLKLQKPSAIEILSKCRIAIEEKFVTPDTTLTDGDKVFIIPPSSGG